MYRLIPVDKHDLTKGGKLQALQVLSARTHTPITFQGIDATHPTGGIFTDDQKDISSYGVDFDTRWVTVHDTAVDDSGLAFDANALAKAAGATPLKRPENGVFRPGTGFREFFFETTGDTNATSSANAGYGGWGTAYRLSQSGPSADHGKLHVLFQGDQAHDNEITGIHMSDGDPSPAGILGAKVPQPFRNGWRLFWTQQHGQNVTWEIAPS